MSDVTIKQLAELLNMSPDKLLTQLDQAGMQFSSPDDVVSDEQKTKLLDFLRASHGKNGDSSASGEKAPGRITLKRRRVSALKVSSGSGRKATSKTVNVQVRGKRTYVKRGDVGENEQQISEREEARRRLQESQRQREREETEQEQQRLRREGKASKTPEAVTPAESSSAVAAPEGKAASAEAATAKAEAPVATKEEPKADAGKPDDMADSSNEAAEAIPATEAKGEVAASTEPKAATPSDKKKTSRQTAETEPSAPVKETATKSKSAQPDTVKKKTAKADKPSAESSHGSSRSRNSVWDTPVMPHLHERRKRREKKPAETAETRPGKKRSAKKASASEQSQSRRTHDKGKAADHRTHQGKKSGKLHLSDKDRSRRKDKRNKGKGGAGNQNTSASQHGFSRPTAPVVHEVPVGETNVVSDLAQKMAVKGAEVVKALFKMGVMATINQSIDHDTAVLVVEELGHKVVEAEAKDAETTLFEETMIASEEGDKKPRPPVVTIMGHVDHGKTSLLDYIRRTKIATDEAGGITQHIGAYHIETPTGVVTFLDTPGHAAFSSMRARGAKSTDVVVLVVAADDGVKPQTLEAIKHAKAANVPLVVAVNKIDKAEANVDNVKQGLASHEVIPEDWGGDTQFVEVSAKTGQGIDQLLESISLQAEVMELQAVVDARATGTVIEARLERGRGSVATMLVQSGTLHKGDFVVCGVEYGRMRALTAADGKQVQEAGPSIPVQVLGLSGVPAAGDDFIVVADERLARQVAEEREQRRREKRLVGKADRLEDIMARMGKEKDQQVLNILIKADVRGTAEALRESLAAIGNESVKVNVVSSGVGGINESDVTLASTSHALLIGFNVRADASARKLVETNGVDLRYFSIIYDVIDQVTQVATGMLGMEIREEIIGVAQVLDVFRSSRFGAVAGCMIDEGKVQQNKPIRVLRQDTVIYEGELESLRRFKDNVDEVRAGTECGIAVKQYNDVKAGDRIECFERIEIPRTL